MTPFFGETGVTAFAGGVTLGIVLRHIYAKEARSKGLIASLPGRLQREIYFEPGPGSLLVQF